MGNRISHFRLWQHFLLMSCVFSWVTQRQSVIWLLFVLKLDTHTDFHYVRYHCSFFVNLEWGKAYTRGIALFLLFYTKNLQFSRSHPCSNLNSLFCSSNFSSLLSHSTCYKAIAIQLQYTKAKVSLLLPLFPHNWIP